MVTQDDSTPLVERDKAVAQLISKAEGGDLHAQYLTGRLYLDGPVLVPDWLTAGHWFDQATRQGYATAQYELGKLLLTNDPEIRDPALGIQWLERAAHSENGHAAYRLGKEYLTGEIVPKDTVKARDCFIQSAEAGNPYAQYALGKLYLDEHDQEQAYYWFAQSATQGNKYAQFFLDRWDSLKPPSVMLAATRLLHHMSRVFQDQTPSPPVSGDIQVDRKLMAKIREKKIAAGHKPDDHEEPSQGQMMSM